MWKECFRENEEKDHTVTKNQSRTYRFAHILSRYLSGKSHTYRYVDILLRCLSGKSSTYRYVDILSRYLSGKVLHIDMSTFC